YSPLPGAGISWMIFADLSCLAVTVDVHIARKDHPCLCLACDGSYLAVNLWQSRPIRVGCVDAIVEELHSVKGLLECLDVFDGPLNQVHSIWIGEDLRRFGGIPH